MKKKILFLYYTQFGYHTDLYMYGKYLDSQKYEVHYFCFDLNLPKIDLNNVEVHYQPLTSNRISNYLKYFYNLNKLLTKEKFDVIFHVDSRYPLIIRMLNLFKPIILDIRSGDLSNNKYKLWIKNKQIAFSTKFYRNVSIISESLRDTLNLDRNRTKIIPLGAEKLLTKTKDFQQIRLFYIGSIDHRNIQETILGLSLYLKSEKAFQNISYDIVGFGKPNVVDQLNSTIISEGLTNKVIFHGRKKIDELFFFFEKCNIGIAYLPQTKSYDCQPVTKLFEYLLAGMPVIATNTLENRLVMKPEFGEITEDNPVDFAKSLEKIILNREKYNSEQIKESCAGFEWENIVKSKLEPYLDGVLSDKNQ
jgi:glycosyltransferase involved in cell wall biosynthesis